MSNGLPASISKLHGNYMLIIMHHPSRSIQVLIDNSGIFDVYYSQSAVSDSFLELIAASGANEMDMDPESVIEFLNFGMIYEDRTLFPSIRRIRSDQLISIDSSGSIQVGTKGIPTGIDAAARLSSIPEHFRLLSQSIQNRKVSVDLTGGIDSRLLVSLLHQYGADMELSVVGSPEDEDVQLARKVADKLGLPLHVCMIEEEIDGHLPELFRLCDGMFDVFAYYTAYQHSVRRIARGADLVLTGGGAELLSDRFWLQDFPFYSRKRTNLTKLMNLKVLPISCSDHYFQGRYQAASRLFKEQLRERLTCYEADMNTRSNDQIYYHFKEQTRIGRFNTIGTQLTDNYTPFIELEVTRYGYHLPRWERFYNHTHRQLMTSANRAVAAIPTTDGGTTVSALWYHQWLDLYKYTRYNAGKLYKKIAQKLTKKSYYNRGSKRRGFPVHLLQGERSLTWEKLLKDAGILHQTMSLSQLHQEKVGHFISLALLLEHMQSHQLNSKK